MYFVVATIVAHTLDIARSVAFCLLYMPLLCALLGRLPVHNVCPVPKTF